MGTEESKKIWEENAQFWDNAMGDESNEFHREVVRPKVENDCRIILESAQIIARTEDPKVSQSRPKLIRERYKHLMTLKPFADRSQRTMIRDAEQAYRKV